MKKILTLTLLIIFTIIKTQACAVVEISGPSEMYIDAPNNERERATFTAENLEGHIWRTSVDTYLYTEWEFILGTKRGEQVTYDTESMANLQPGTYTLKCTSYFSMYGGSTQVDTKEITITRGPSPDLVVNFGQVPSQAYENSTTNIQLVYSNEGEVKSPPSTVRVYFEVYNGDGNHGQLDVNRDFLAGTFNLPEIPASTYNQRKAVTIKTPDISFNTSSGFETKTMWVIIDPYNEILEKNEGNNIGAPYSITINYNSSNPNGIIKSLVKPPLDANSNQILYPNPSKDIINLTEELNNITILTQYGEKIKSFNKSSTQLDISHLNSGNYILQGLDKSNTLRVIRFQKK